MATAEVPEYDNESVITYRDFASGELKAHAPNVFYRRAVCKKWLCMNASAVEGLIAVDDDSCVYWYPARCSTPMPESFLTEEVWVCVVRPAYSMAFAIAKKVEERQAAATAAAEAFSQQAFDDLMREAEKEKQQQEEKKRQEQEKKMRQEEKKKEKRRKKEEASIDLRTISQQPIPQLQPPHAISEPIPPIDLQPNPQLQPPQAIPKPIAPIDLQPNPQQPIPQLQPPHAIPEGQIEIQAIPHLQTSTASTQTSAIPEPASEANAETSATEDDIKLMLKGIQGQLTENFDRVVERVDDMYLELIDLRSDMDKVHYDLSLLAERSCRTALVGFVADRFPGFRIVQPVLSKKVPYKPQAQLEALAHRCGRIGTAGYVLVREMPQRAEIDIYMKLRKQSALHRPSRKSPDRRSNEFDQVFLAEVYRGTMMCNTTTSFQHPAEQSTLTKSSKLLYKLIQLERGVIATLAHCNCRLAVDDLIAGVAVISPSFKETTTADGERLIETVLNACAPGELPNIRHLYKKKVVWLLDI